MKLIVDMNLAPRWAEYLSQAGHEAQHWSTLGALNATDVTVMQAARERDAVVLTHDLDFGAILAVTGGAKPSVIQIRADASAQKTSDRPSSARCGC